MALFFFRIKAIPTTAATVAHDIGGAFSHVWVVDDGMTGAETKARAFVMDHGWLVEEVELALEPTPEQLLDLGEAETANYQKALRQGIASVFHAWPRDARPAGVVELRSMGSPLGDGTKQ